MGLVKVDFELQIEEDGFPPINVETLNGIMQRDGFIKLDNTPFFAVSVAANDIIECVKIDGKNNFQFVKVVKESGYKALSIIFLNQNIEEEIYQYFKKQNCYCEYGEFEGFNMLAVSIGLDVDYDLVSSYLNSYESEEKLSYAELCL